jgi:hypothetical protein
VFSASAAVGATRELLAARASEAEKLGKIHAYLHGQQPAPINVIGAPQEVKDLAGMSRVNIARLPVDVLAQSLFVDGFHQPTIEGNEPVWGAWQANRMDARQTGIFRAALGAVVMPGSDMPVEAIKVGEFSQTDTSSFLEAREASIRHMAIISQVAPHDLLGQMVNLSADALAAAEQSKIRKINERQTSFGESMEQTFQLVGRSMGAPVADDAEVRWRDPEARSLAQTADALVKLQQVGVPVEMLLEMIPKLTQSGIERAKALINRNGAFGDLQNILAEAVPPPVVEPAAA